MNQFYLICVSIGAFLRIKDAGFAKGFPTIRMVENLIYDVLCIDSKSFLIVPAFGRSPPRFEFSSGHKKDAAVAHSSFSKNRIISKDGKKFS